MFHFFCCSRRPLTPPSRSPKSVAVICITFLPVYITPLCQTAPAAPVTPVPSRLPRPNCDTFLEQKGPLCLRVQWEGRRFNSLTSSHSTQTCELGLMKSSIKHGETCCQPGERRPLLQGVMNEIEGSGGRSSVASQLLNVRHVWPQHHAFWLHTYTVSETQFQCSTWNILVCDDQTVSAFKEGLFVTRAPCLHIPKVIHTHKTFGRGDFEATQTVKLHQMTSLWSQD